MYDEIIGYVSKSKLSLAIDKLIQYFNDNPEIANIEEYKSQVNQLILISSRLSEIKKQTINGTIEKSHELIERNRISASLLQLIDIIRPIISDNTSHNEKHISKKEMVGNTNPFSLKYDIFLCYSSANTYYANEIFEILTDLGIKVFFAEEKLKTDIGISYFSTINNALEQSRLLLLLATDDSMNSEWVKSEYETFYNECFIPNPDNRKIAIYKLKELPISKIPIGLRRLQVTDNAEELLNFLLTELNSNLELKDSSNNISTRPKRMSEKLKEYIESPEFNDDLENDEDSTDEKKKTVLILLTRGESPDGKSIYAYVAIESSKIVDFMKAQDEGLFYPEDHGIIIAKGEGEPSKEVKNMMERDYGFNHDEMIDIED